MIFEYLKNSESYRNRIETVKFKKGLISEIEFVVNKTPHVNS